MGHGVGDQIGQHLTEARLWSYLIAMEGATSISTARSGYGACNSATICWTSGKTGCGSDLRERHPLPDAAARQIQHVADDARHARNTFLNQGDQGPGSLVQFPSLQQPRARADRGHAGSSNRARARQ